MNEKIQVLAKNFLFPVPKDATFSESDSFYHLSEDESDEPVFLPLLHLPIVDFVEKAWTGNCTHAYLHCIPNSKYLFIYAHPNAVDMGMAVRDAYFMGVGAESSVLLFEYTGYGLTQQVEPCETSMYTDAFSAYWFARTVLNVPRERIVLVGRSIGSAVMAHLAAHLPSVVEEEAIIKKYQWERVNGIRDRSSSEGGEPSGSLPLVVLQCPFTDVPSCVSHFSGTDALSGVARYLGLNWFPTISVIDRILSPVLFHHGTKDKTVPFSHSKELIKKRDQSERPLVSYLYEEEGKGHSNLSCSFLVAALRMRLDLALSPLPIVFPLSHVVHEPIYRNFFCIETLTEEDEDEVTTADNSPRKRGDIGSSVVHLASVRKIRAPLVSHLIARWKQGISLKEMMHRKNLSVILTLSVSIFSMRCARLWQEYCECRCANPLRCREEDLPLKDMPDREEGRNSVQSPISFASQVYGFFSGAPSSLSASKSSAYEKGSSRTTGGPGLDSTLPELLSSSSVEAKPSRETFLHGCMARWGSPLGVHIARFSDEASPLHVIFGMSVSASGGTAHLDYSWYLRDLSPVGEQKEQPGAVLGGATPKSSPSSAGILYLASVAELRCPASLILIMKNVMSSYSLGETSHEISSEDFSLSSLQCFITDKQVASIQTECERLVVAQTQEEVDYWDALLADAMYYAPSMPVSSVPSISSDDEKENGFSPVDGQKSSSSTSDSIARRRRLGTRLNRDSQLLLTHLDESTFCRGNEKNRLPCDSPRTPTHAIPLSSASYLSSSSSFSQSDEEDLSSQSMQVFHPVPRTTLEDISDYMTQWQPLLSVPPDCGVAREKVKGGSSALKLQRSFSERSFGSFRTASLTKLEELAGQVKWDYYLLKTRAACHHPWKKSNEWDSTKRFVKEQHLLGSVYAFWQRYQGWYECSRVKGATDISDSTSAH